MDDPISQDLLEIAAERWPDSLALCWQGQTWTYRDLDYAASEIAARVPAGERVAFRAEMSAASVAAVWGIPRGGGIAVPLDPALEVEAAAHLADSFGATLGWPEQTESLRSEREPVPDEPAYVVATSGSSGEPRGVILTFGNVTAAVFASTLHLGTRHGDRWLHAMPLHHVAGLAILWRAAYDGAAVELLHGFDSEEFAAGLQRANWASVVPTMLRRIIGDVGVIPDLRGVLVGGAHLPDELLLQARAAGLPALATYGMTETTSQACTVIPGQEESSLGTVGFPLPGVAVSIDAAPGSAGPILVDGPTVSPGYVNEPPRRGPHRTSDIGFFDDAGRLVVLGRSDDVIISGGENVNPRVVEARLRELVGVEDAFVFGVPDEEWGDRVVAVVSGAGLDAAALAELVSLPPAARPKDIRIVSELPRLTTGKIDRAAAAALFTG